MKSADPSPDDAHRIPVWIVDNNKNFCVVLSEALNRSKTVRCTRYSFSCRSAIQDLEQERERPEVILLDIKMPEMSGLEALPRFKKLSPQTKIVMLTSYDFDRDIQTAIERGASGYLLKSATPADVIRAIETSRAGGAPIDPMIAKRMMNTFATPVPPGSTHNLSPREQEILRCLAEGVGTQEVAKKFSISEYTVETHIRNIFEKLGVHNRHAMVAKAIRERLI